MSERLIDSVCPHCGRLRTTVRVVKHEDGFTKLSRLCKECGDEWIHTFDADWLAVAKMRRLEAEVERLRARVEQLDQVREAALNASADWYLSLRVDQRDSIEYVEPNIGLMGSMSKLSEIAWDATPATQNATGARGKP